MRQDGSGDYVLRGCRDCEVSGMELALKKKRGQKYKASFFDNSWDTIIDACQSGDVPETWAIADSKGMTINGTNYQIDIIGKNHDTYAAGGTAPLTFQLHDCYGAKDMMNTRKTNSGGWTNSYMRTLVLPSILSCMPQEIQAAIKQVNKLTSDGNMSSYIRTTADKLFLLSQKEITGNAGGLFSGNYLQNTVDGEGSIYAYYATGHSTIKTVGGAASEWWERSPIFQNQNAFAFISSSGAKSTDSNNANFYWGVSPAFCF